MIEEKPLVILITSYNNIRWVENNLRSVAMQKYSNYRVIFIDDCSIDDTAEKAKALIANSSLENRTTFISNPTRIGALENIYNGVYLCKDDEIIISLDGDDWFSDCRVLSKINEIYSASDIWLTHGTLIEYPNNNVSWCIPVPTDLVEKNLFRTYRCPSHLRTFYAWLFKKIDVNDLMHEGEFFPMTWDQAMMFPMIEMAAERHAFISDVVYVYNVANSINDNKVDPSLQNRLEAIIRAMPPYSRLEKSPLEKE
jgi:glycosyltransferase involved in cell wall biosynthesis